MVMALELAAKAERADEVPVGAIVVRDGEIIGRGHNATISRNDPTAHAEMLVIRDAASRLARERLGECDLFVTLEPCAMCAAAISYARIRRVYYGASDPKGGGVENGPRIFNQPTCHHVPEVYSGISEQDAAALLRTFFFERRGS